MKIVEELKESELKIYYVIAFFITIILLFFLNSNRLLNSKYDLLNSEINAKVGIQEYSVVLLDKEYNKETHLIKFALEIENKDDSCELKSEIVEKSNVKKKIDSELIKVDDNKYVVYSTLPNKWSVISLRIKKTEGKYKARAIKLYASNIETKQNDNLVKLDRGTLACEFIDKDINVLNEQLNSLDKQIKEKKTSIHKQEDIISSISKDKMFETKKEQDNTDENIKGIQKQIEYVKLDITNILKQEDEIKEKIGKLELKKKYISNQ